MAVERESKFDVDGSFVVPFPPGLMVVCGGTTLLRATYWDTPDLRLLAAGISLRHRIGGDESRWTVKLPALSYDPVVVARSEIHLTGDPGAPPARARELLAGVVRGKGLVPVATLVTDRRFRRLGAPGATATVELADDRVTSMFPDDQWAAGRVAEAGPSFRQVEVEQLGDSATEASHPAASVTSRAVGEAGGVPTLHSKVARVLRESGRVPAVPGTHRSRNGSISAAVSGVIGDGLAALVAADPGIRVDRDVEDVHQARVATRRLRSVFRILRPALRRSVVDELRSELAWLGGLLGAVRDRDVLAVAFRRDGSRTGDGHDLVGLDGLLALLGAERDAARLELLDAMASDRYLDLFDRLEQAAGRPPLRGDVDGSDGSDRVWAAACRAAWERVERDIAHLPDDPDDLELHELRKRVKRVRYAVDAAGAAGGRRARRLAKRLGHLQDSLGDIQDSVTAQRWLDSVPVDAVPPAVAYALGRLWQVHDERRRTRRDGWRPLWDDARTASLRRWMRD